jgi:hypothetical protein
MFRLLFLEFLVLIVVGVVGNSLTYPPIVLPCGRVKNGLVFLLLSLDGKKVNLRRPTNNWTRKPVGLFFFFFFG